LEQDGATLFGICTIAVLLKEYLILIQEKIANVTVVFC